MRRSVYRFFVCALLLLFGLTSVCPGPAFALRPAGVEEQNKKSRNEFVSRLRDRDATAPGVFPHGNIPRPSAPAERSARPASLAGAEEGIQARVKMKGQDKTLPLTVFETPEDIGRAQADQVMWLWKTAVGNVKGGGRPFVIGLATGSTPKPILAALAERLNGMEPGIRARYLEKLYIVAMDDIVDGETETNVGQDHERSAYRFFRENFCKLVSGFPDGWVSTQMESTHLFVPTVGQVSALLARVKQLGGVSWQLMATDPNEGRVAEVWAGARYRDPAAHSRFPVDSARPLSPLFIQHNPWATGYQGITLRLDDFVEMLADRAVVSFAIFGAAKRDILSRFERAGAYDAELPITFLWLLDWEKRKARVEVLADRAVVGTAAAVRPDGRALAVGNQGGAVRVWDLSSGGLHTTLQAGAGPVSALRFSSEPPGDLLFAETADGETYQWPVPILDEVEMWGSILLGPEIPSTVRADPRRSNARMQLMQGFLHRSPRDERAWRILELLTGEMHLVRQHHEQANASSTRIMSSACLRDFVGGMAQRHEKEEAIAAALRSMRQREDQAGRVDGIRVALKWLSETMESARGWRDTPAHTQVNALLAILGPEGEQTAANVPAAGQEEWTEIPSAELPKGLYDDLAAEGVILEKVEYIVIRPPDGGKPLKQPFAHPGAAAGIPMSVNQTLGSYFFKGRKMKVVSDGNAVALGFSSLVEYSIQHPSEAFIILGDEGKRDYSISLRVGTIIYRGKEIWFKDMRKLRAKLRQLLGRGVRIQGVITDALEVTEKQAEGKPDSWGVTAIIDLPQSYEALKTLALIPDELRRVGWVYHAKSEAQDLDPFDLPEEGFKKIARADGVDVDDPEAFSKWMAERRQVTLGSEKRKFLGPARQQGQELAQKHPGFDTYYPTDGNLFPRLRAAMGSLVGGHVEVGAADRVGSIEEFIAMTGANNVEGAHYASTYVSAKNTEGATSLYAQIAHDYHGSERRDAAGLGIGSKQLTAIDTKEAGTWPHKGPIAMTIVTGASKEMAGEWADLLKEVEVRLEPDGRTGRFVLITFVLAQDGSAYIVRTTLWSDDLPEAVEWLKLASRLPAPVPLPAKKPQGETQTLSGLAGVVDADNIPFVNQHGNREISRTFRYVLPEEMDQTLKQFGMGYHLTFLHPGQIGTGASAEYYRTRGHFHVKPDAESEIMPVGELVEVYEGRGSVLLWRVSSLDDPGLAGEAIRLQVKAGDQFFVPWGFGHLGFNEDPQQMLVFGTWLRRDVKLAYSPVVQVRGGPWYVGLQGVRANSNYGAVANLEVRIPNRAHMEDVLGIPSDRSLWSVAKTDPARFAAIMKHMSMESNPVLTAEDLFTAPAAGAEETVNVAMSVGGTKSAAGVSAAQGILGTKENRPAPLLWTDLRAQYPDQKVPLERTLAEMVRQVRGALEHFGIDPERLGEVGISWAGPGDYENGRVENEKMADLGLFPMVELGALLARRLEEEFGRPVAVRIMHDGAAGALGEHNLPKGKLYGRKHGMAIIFGTGIGVGIIQDGKPVYAVEGMVEAFLGEIGWHLITRGDGTYAYAGAGAKPGVPYPHKPTNGEWAFEQDLAGPWLAAQFILKMREAGMTPEQETELFGQVVHLVEDDLVSLSDTRRLRIPKELQEVEKQMLVMITERAKAADAVARNFIEDAGARFGSAIRAFRQAYAGQPFADEGRIVLISSLGENFGLGVTDAQGEDLFMAAARRTAGWDDIVRSEMGYEREFAFTIPAPGLAEWDVSLDNQLLSILKDEDRALLAERIVPLLFPTESRGDADVSGPLQSLIKELREVANGRYPSDSFAVTSFESICAAHDTTELSDGLLRDLYRWVNAYLLLPQGISLAAVLIPEVVPPGQTVIHRRLFLVEASGYELHLLPNVGVPRPVVYHRPPGIVWKDEHGSSTMGVSYVTMSPSVTQMENARREELAHAADEVVLSQKAPVTAYEKFNSDPSPELVSFLSLASGGSETVAHSILTEIRATLRMLYGPDGQEEFADFQPLWKFLNNQFGGSDALPLNAAVLNLVMSGQYTPGQLGEIWVSHQLVLGAIDPANPIDWKGTAEVLWRDIFTDSDPIELEIKRIHPESDAEAAQQVQRLSQPAAGAEEGIRRLLVVEDSAVYRTKVVAAAKEWAKRQGRGLDVVEAGSYLSAVETYQAAMASENPFDAVLTDLQLGDGNGDDLIRKVINPMGAGKIPAAIISQGLKPEDPFYKKMQTNGQLTICAAKKYREHLQGFVEGLMTALDEAKKAAAGKDEASVQPAARWKVVGRERDLPAMLFETAEEAGEFQADEVMSLWGPAVEAGEPFVIGLPTGSTPLPLLSALAERLNAMDRDRRLIFLDSLRILAMDDIVDNVTGQNVEPTHDRSAYRFFQEKFFDHIADFPADWSSADIESTHLFVPTVGKVSAQAERVAALGKVKWQLMATDPNEGHVAEVWAGERYRDSQFPVDQPREMSPLFLEHNPWAKGYLGITLRLDDFVDLLADGGVVSFAVFGAAKRDVWDRFERAGQYDPELPISFLWHSDWAARGARISALVDKGLLQGQVKAAAPRLLTPPEGAQGSDANPQVMELLRAYILQAQSSVEVEFPLQRFGSLQEFLRPPLDYQRCTFAGGSNPGDLHGSGYGDWSGMAWHLRHWAIRLNALNRTGEKAKDASNTLDRFRVVEQGPGRLRVEPVLGDVSPVSGRDEAEVSPLTAGQSEIQRALELAAAMDANAKQHQQKVLDADGNFVGPEELVKFLQSEGVRGVSLFDGGVVSVDLVPVSVHMEASDLVTKDVYPRQLVFSFSPGSVDWDELSLYFSVAPEELAKQVQPMSANRLETVGSPDTSKEVILRVENLPEIPQVPAGVFDQDVTFSVARGVGDRVFLFAHGKNLRDLARKLPAAMLAACRMASVDPAGAVSAQPRPLELNWLRDAQAVAYDPIDKKVYVMVGFDVQEFDATTGQPTGRIFKDVAHHPVLMRVDPNRRILLVMDSEKIARVDLHSGEILAPFHKPVMADHMGFDYSAEEKAIVVVNVIGHVQILNSDTGALTGEFSTNVYHPHGVAYDPAGKRIFVVSGNGGVYAFNSETGSPLGVVGSFEKPPRITWSKAFNQLLVYGQPYGDAGVQLLDPTTGEAGLPLMADAEHIDALDYAPGTGTVVVLEQRMFYVPGQLFMHRVRAFSDKTWEPTAVASGLAEGYNSLVRDIEEFVQEADQEFRRYHASLLPELESPDFESQDLYIGDKALEELPEDERLLVEVGRFGDRIRLDSVLLNLKPGGFQFPTMAALEIGANLSLLTGYKVFLNKRLGDPPNLGKLEGDLKLPEGEGRAYLRWCREIEGKLRQWRRTLYLLAMTFDGLHIEPSINLREVVPQLRSTDPEVRSKALKQLRKFLNLTALVNRFLSQSTVPKWINAAIDLMLSDVVKDDPEVRAGAYDVLFACAEYGVAVKRLIPALEPAWKDLLHESDRVRNAAKNLIVVLTEQPALPKGVRQELAIRALVFFLEHGAHAEVARHLFDAMALNQHYPAQLYLRSLGAVAAEATSEIGEPEQPWDEDYVPPSQPMPVPWVYPDTVKLAVPADAASALGLQQGGYREDIPVQDLAGLLCFLEAERFPLTGKAPTPDPLSNEPFGARLFRAVQGGTVAVEVNDERWEDPLAPFPPDATVKLKPAAGTEEGRSPLQRILVVGVDPARVEAIGQVVSSLRPDADVVTAVLPGQRSEVASLFNVPLRQPDGVIVAGDVSLDPQLGIQEYLESIEDLPVQYAGEPDEVILREALWAMEVGQEVTVRVQLDLQKGRLTLSRVEAALRGWLTELRRRPSKRGTLPKELRFEKVRVQQGLAAALVRGYVLGPDEAYGVMDPLAARIARLSIPEAIWGQPDFIDCVAEDIRRLRRLPIGLTTPTLAAALAKLEPDEVEAMCAHKDIPPERRRGIVVRAITAADPRQKFEELLAREKERSSAGQEGEVEVAVPMIESPEPGLLVRAGWAFGDREKTRLGAASAEGQGHILYNEATLAALFFLHAPELDSPVIAVVDPARLKQLRTIAWNAGFTEEQIRQWEADHVEPWDPDAPEGAAIARSVDEAERRARERIAKQMGLPEDAPVEPKIIFTLPRARAEFGVRLEGLLKSFGFTLYSEGLSPALVQALYEVAQA